ncbi:MAG: hypothetical protein ACE5GX_20180 [Thermoanaerobaculia bacterium]
MAAAEFTFHLVPSDKWHGSGSDLVNALPTGSIYIYAEDNYDPSFVAEANVPIELPIGSWYWIAEAPGYVSVDGGTIHVELGQEGHKSILWPVVPACEAVLGPGSWNGVDRLDIVGVDSGSVFPIRPKTRRRLMVPAGRLVAYGVYSGQLVGIENLGTCGHEETIEVPIPETPQRDRMDLMVSTVLPEDPKIDERGLSVVVAPTGSPSETGRPPTTIAWQGAIAHHFFVGVPVPDRAELRIKHPALRSVVRTLDVSGGDAVELPSIALSPRLDLRVGIDYRPKREHRVAQVEAYYCGRRAFTGPVRLSNCQPVESLPLEHGLKEYVFRQVDDGAYVLQARIDSEVVFGVGNNLLPYLDPQAAEPPQLPIAWLWEMEIYGNLLIDDDPVPGTVVLLDNSTDGSSRRFPTDDELVYRLFYFGRLPFMPGLLPEGDEERPPERNLGLFAPYSLAACSEDNYCRLFNIHSSFRGEGRLDLDLGTGSELVVEVLDAENAEPVPEARVVVPVERQALHFDHGEVEWQTPRGIEGASILTDPKGVARVRLSSDGSWVAVTKDGYKDYRTTLTGEPAQWSPLTVHLEREQEHGGFQLSFRDGKPLVNGFLLVIDGNGSRNLRCSRRTNGYGKVDVPEACLEGKGVVVLHREAAITVLHGSALLASGQAVVERAPNPPLRVQVVTHSGNPLPRVPLELQYRSLVLGPNDFLAGATYTGDLLFYLTDERGELTLRGVDPDAPDAPTVSPAIDLPATSESLALYRGGDIVRLVVEAGEN